MIGTVNWFATKGQSYGFIDYQKDDQHLQIYVHYKSIGTKNLRPENLRGKKWHREVRKGDIVEFDIVGGFGVDGTQAANVEILMYG